jgi:hypothetical protein
MENFHEQLADALQRLDSARGKLAMIRAEREALDVRTGRRRCGGVRAQSGEAMIGRRGNVGQSASTSDKRESASLVRARETWSGADLGRDHGALTAEAHLRALLKEARERIATLESENADLRKRLERKGRTRKPRGADVVPMRRRAI